MFFAYLASLIAASQGSVDGYTIYIHNFKDSDKAFAKMLLMD